MNKIVKILVGVGGGFAILAAGIGIGTASSGPEPEQVQSQPPTQTPPPACEAAIRHGDAIIQLAAQSMTEQDPAKIDALTVELNRVSPMYHNAKQLCVVPA